MQRGLEHISGPLGRRKQPFFEPLKPMTLKHVLDDCTSDRDRLLILLRFTANLRWTELSYLRLWDLVGSNLGIREWISVPAHAAKDSNARCSVKLPLATREAILAFVQDRFLHDKSLPVFPTAFNREKSLWPQSLWRIISDAFRRTGIEVEDLAKVAKSTYFHYYRHDCKCFDPKVARLIYDIKNLDNSERFFTKPLEGVDGLAYLPELGRSF